MREYEEMTIQVDSDLFNQVSEICARAGTSIEILTECFLRFCVAPEYLPLVEAFLGKESAPAEAGAKEDVNRMVVDKVFSMAVEEAFRQGLPDNTQP